MKLDATTYRPARLRERISLHKRCLQGAGQSVDGAVGIDEKIESRVHARYQERLRASNALDFDDLLAKVIELFNVCPEALRR